MLDAGVLGMVCPASRKPSLAGFRLCLIKLAAGGSDILIPDGTSFEVQRELLRLNAKKRLLRHDNFCSEFALAAVTAEAWERAAKFWAIVRQAGRPTASPDALDADAILASVAATIARPGDQVVIATTILRHLNWFPGVDARRWELVV